MTSRKGPVLIVDDDVDIRDALADVLEERGFEVVTAGNGLDALRLIRSMQVRPCVILLDLMMPIMDGYGFLAERDRDPALRLIPVAIITAGYGVDRDRLGIGTTIVPKPIDVRRLVGILRDLRATDGLPG